jgi:hypothetical protein
MLILTESPYMAMTEREKEWATKTTRFIKAELKRAGIGYRELAQRLNDHGLDGETEDSIASKLTRGTYSATWLLAVLAVLELDGLILATL